MELEDVPHSPVYDTDEVINDPQVKQLQIEIKANHPEGGEWHTIRSPISFDGQRPLEVTAPPILGEANDEIRKKYAG